MQKETRRESEYIRAKREAYNASGKKRYLTITTKHRVYHLQFGHIQIEVTGLCNMRCVHCRAADEAKAIMPETEILKILAFVRTYSPTYKEVTISGGEPLLYPGFLHMMGCVRDFADIITMTTNGTYLTQEIIDSLKALHFERFFCSVSLDSVEEARHNALRQYPTAYEDALRALRLLVKNKDDHLKPRIRMTLRPEEIPHMEAMVQFAKREGVRRISFSGIHATGRATGCPELFMTKGQKQAFLHELFRLRAKYPGFNLKTSDPLQRLLEPSRSLDRADVVFDGCGAGATTFNVSVNGDLTPCSLLPVPLFNVNNKSPADLEDLYANHPFVHRMLDMDFTGRCGECIIKYQCGGCRVRALYESGDVFGSDPHCFK